MSLNEEVRAFFITFSNGDVFYFNINKNGEIFCREFTMLFGNMLPLAYCIEITNNGFILQNGTGNKICSLEDYRNILNNINKDSSMMAVNDVFVEELFIDEDVKINLLISGKIKCNEEVGKKIGLFDNSSYKKNLFR